MKTSTRHRKWRERYGQPRRDKDGNVIGRWTYRALAQDFGVDPSTVWAVINADKLKARRKVKAADRDQHDPRPVSVRIALSKDEYAVVKGAAASARTSMTALVRGVLFGDRAALSLGTVDEDEPVLE